MLREVERGKGESRLMTRWSTDIQGKEEQHRLKRQALLRTAARTFNETGFHQTTLDDVAQKLGVSKPALYLYIKSKDDILFECSRVALAQAQEALERAKAQGTTGLEKVRLFLKSYASIIVQDFGTCLILAGDEPLTQENRQVLRTARASVDLAVRQMIEEGITDGSIAPCNPKMVTFTLFGAFNWLAHWYQEEGELQPEAVAAQFLSLFESGLVPRANK